MIYGHYHGHYREFILGISAFHDSVMDIHGRDKLHILLAYS